MSASDSDSDRHHDSDDEGKSSSASKQVLKAIPSMGDMLYPMADTNKASSGKPTKKATKLSDFMRRPTATIKISTRKRPDMLNATRKYDRRQKKLVVEIPTKEVKSVTIEREVKQDITDLAGSDLSRKRQRSPSPVRTDTQRAEDYAEEICDKCDDFQEQVRELSERGYYRDFQTDDDCRVMQAILTLLDRAIANNNRNLNELKSLGAHEMARSRVHSAAPSEPNSDKPSNNKRQKTSDKSQQDKSKAKKEGKTSSKKSKPKSKSKASKMKE